jgi:hypothetical protein
LQLESTIRRHDVLDRNVGGVSSQVEPKARGGAHCRQIRRNVGNMSITVVRREAVDLLGTCYRSGRRVFLESYTLEDLKRAAPRDGPTVFNEGCGLGGLRRQDEGASFI